jgi:hypothetical protein
MVLMIGIIMVKLHPSEHEHTAVDKAISDLTTRGKRVFTLL